MDSISEKLNRKPERKGSKKLKFLALQNQIAEALNNGHSVVAVWELLRDEKLLEITYPQFTLYVRTYIKKNILEQSIAQKSETFYSKPYSSSRTEKTVASTLNAQSENQIVEPQQSLRQEKPDTPKKFHFSSTPPSDDELA